MVMIGSVSSPTPGRTGCGSGRGRGFDQDGAVESASCRRIAVGVESGRAGVSPFPPPATPPGRQFRSAVGSRAQGKGGHGSDPTPAPTPPRPGSDHGHGHGHGTDPAPAPTRPRARSRSRRVKVAVVLTHPPPGSDAASVAHPAAEYYEVVFSVLFALVQLSRNT
jgi:hypothetical protein